MRRSLHIGINYEGTSAALSGCLNDANNAAAAMRDRGFDEVTTLLERDATKPAILEAVTDLVERTGPDDFGLATISSHGTYGADRTPKDEPDGKDEGWVAYGMQVVWDDDLYVALTSGHRWARLAVLSDTCFAGGVNRLASPVGDSYQRVRFLPPAARTDDRTELDRARLVEHRPVRGKPRPSVPTLAACQEHEVAYCAEVDGQPQGIFTWAALKALDDLAGQPTYWDWEKRIRAYLPSSDYRQTPLLLATPHMGRWFALEEDGAR